MLQLIVEQSPVLYSVYVAVGATSTLGFNGCDIYFGFRLRGSVLGHRGAVSKGLVTDTGIRGQWCVVRIP